MSDTRSIAELTRSIRRGDPEALTWLYRSRVDRMVAHARSRTHRDESFCLDAVQETFLRVIRSLPKLDSDAALDAWLLRTLDRCALDALRTEARRRRREAAHDRPTSTRPADSRGDSTASSDDGATLDDRVAALPTATRSLIEARFRFGWTLARIGSWVGLAPGAVDGRIARAIERLRKELDDEPT